MKKRTILVFSTLLLHVTSHANMLQEDDKKKKKEKVKTDNNNVLKKEYGGKDKPHHTIDDGAAKANAHTIDGGASPKPPKVWKQPPDTSHPKAH